MRRVLLALPVLVAGTGCGVLLFSDDGDEGPPPVPALASDAAADDAATGTVDASPPADAGAVAPTSCGARWCFSFDPPDQAVSPFGWDRVDTAGGAPIAFFGTRTDAYLSPPNALRVQTTTESGIEQWAALGLGAATTGSVRVNVRVEGVAGVGEVIHFLALACADGRYAARVHLLADRRLSVSHGELEDETSLPNVVLPFRQWKLVRLDFTANATTVVTKLSADGESTTVTATDCAGPLEVRLGATVLRPSAFDLSFDDVAIDASPE